MFHYLAKHVLPSIYTPSSLGCISLALISQVISSPTLCLQIVGQHRTSELLQVVTSREPFASFLLSSSTRQPHHPHLGPTRRFIARSAHRRPTSSARGTTRICAVDCRVADYGDLLGPLTWSVGGRTLFPSSVCCLARLKARCESGPDNT